MPRSGSHVFVKGQPLDKCTREPEAQRDRTICVAAMMAHEGGRWEVGVAAGAQ
jgi:hypothetical protein